MAYSPPPASRGSNVHDDFLNLFQERGLSELASDAGVIKDGEIPGFKEEGGAFVDSARKRRYEETVPDTPTDGFGDHDDHHGKGKKKRAGRSASSSSASMAESSTPSAGTPGSDKQNKGLRHFSMKVCKKVEEKGQTTYNEVADELVAEFLSIGNQNTKPGEKPAFDEKNIRRRVYDALNVLMAMDIISKEKKDIRWKGLPSNAQHDLEGLERDKQRLERNIKKKREQLEQIIEQQVTYMNLVKRNQAREADVHDKKQYVDSISEGDTKIALPFIVINTHHETYIQCEMTEDRAEVMFRFSAPFEINDDNEVLKRLGLHQADDETLQRLFPQKLLDYVPASVRKSSESAHDSW